METNRLFQLLSGSGRRQSASGAQPTIATLGTIRRLDSLYRSMATDYLLREQFVTSPSSVVFDYVYRTQLSPEQARVSDHLIYAVMANPPLVEWLREHAGQAGAGDAKNALASQFARGAVERGAPQVLVALMRSAFEGQQPVGLDEILLPAMIDTHPEGGGDGGTGGGDGGTGGGDGGTGDGGTGTGDGGTGTGDGGTGTGVTLTGTGDGGTGTGVTLTGTGDGGTGTGVTLTGTGTLITLVTDVTNPGPGSPSSRSSPARPRPPRRAPARSP
jgi:hypothetical protein